MEAHQNNDLNGQQGEAIANAQANNEHMEGDYNAEPIEHLNLYEEIIDPRITIHDDAAPFEHAPRKKAVYGPPTYSKVLEKQRGNRIGLQEEQDQFADRPGTGNQNSNPDFSINDQNPAQDAGNRSPVRVLTERDQLLPNWRHMEARLERAVQNVNPDDPIDHRVAEQGLRRSSRVPLYSEKYMQYRSSI
jgi:hypothetical protein